MKDGKDPSKAKFQSVCEKSRHTPGKGKMLMRIFKENGWDELKKTGASTSAGHFGWTDEQQSDFNYTGNQGLFQQSSQMATVWIHSEQCAIR